MTVSPQFRTNCTLSEMALVVGAFDIGTTEFTPMRLEPL
jgi:hypothetical protein